MEEHDVLSGAFAMPRLSPSYPIGPYRFVSREYLTIAYRSDPDTLRRLLPEPLELRLPEVRFQFIRMPDSTGFGEYAMAAQIIPATLPNGEAGGYVHAVYVNSHTANTGGRELWGFPQKLARPSLTVERDTLCGALDFGPVPVARGSMGFKHRAVPEAEAMAELAAPGVLLKIIPHVDGRPRICELVRYQMGELRFKGCWTAPAALQLMPHALAPVAELPVLEVLRATHLIADCTLQLGEVIHDYLSEGVA
ncbi:acetoacetate decarboxylase [Plastoroseomonas arctica]|uniref:Acetoacetate decarboxylase n=1 Tax=Plastoroseomonas arctica TaxID=1509237 RepID=A0AAF1K072_9PROT|nr:acetoacetate decarboxylase [Plastoroseomonas arctica]MBR0657505.1 acetoacetate decarboxylase [Plastoroseomonas arctica]